MTQRERVVTIEALAQSGDGLGHLDGRTVRVPGTLPGERVRVRFHPQLHGSHTEVRVVEQPSPERVAPPCPVFDRCGGCAWQHASPAVQHEARLDWLRRALPPQLRALPVSFHPAPAPYGYRTRARLAWWAPGSQVRTHALGFRARGGTDVVDALRCAVMDPRLEAALAPLREHVGRVARSGEVSIALGHDARPVASLRPTEAVAAQGFGVPEALVARGFAGVALWPPGASVAVTAGDPRPVVPGADGRPLVMSVDGFAQANEGFNLALARYVASQAEARGRTVTELYAGGGNFTVLLAAEARTLTAVESDRAATAALVENLSARGLGTTTVQTATAEDAVRGLHAEVLVLDPPRTGAREVCEALAKGKVEGRRHPVRRVVYVSCDPPTLGRDLGILAGAFDVEALAAFEMFPQTPHLEVVATLVAARR